MSRKLMFKPGTIILLIFIAAVGMVFYSWASGSMASLSRNASQEQKQTVNCASLSTEFLRVDSKGENVTVFFKINRDVETVLVKLQGERNVTRKLEDLRQDSLQGVKGRIGDFRKVKVKVRGCAQVFRYSK